jgi:phosphoribosylpyrophosphate synthetase
MDDLIQTGGTLYECAVALKKAGAQSVSGFVVHAVFPNGSFTRFLRGGDRAVFARFWLSSSNPAVCAQIPSGDVFEVLDLAPRIVHDLVHEPSGRSAWS